MADSASEEKGTNMVKAEKGTQINVVEDFERVVAMVSKVRDAVLTIKDSDISIKEWHFAFDKLEKEYIVDFKLKLIVTPRENQ